MLILQVAAINRIILGAGNDLQIYHDGSHSYIQDSGTGVLKLLGSGVSIQNATGSENIATFAENGSVNLYFNNALKFTTISTGVNITGQIDADTGRILKGSEGLYFSAGGDSANGRELQFTSSNGGSNGSKHQINARSSNGVLSLATANVDALTIDNTQNATFAGSVDVTSGASLGSGLQVNRTGHPSLSIITGGNTNAYIGIAPSGGTYVNAITISDTGNSTFAGDVTVQGATLNLPNSSYQITGGSAIGDLRFVAPRYRFYEDTISGTPVLQLDGGNVTVGSKMIAPKLSIQNQINTSSAGLEINYENGDGTTTNFKNFYVRDGKNAILINVQGETKKTSIFGQVGIGAAAGSAMLDVRGDSDSSDIFVQLDNNKYGSTDTAGETKIGFGWLNHSGASIAAYKDGTVNRTGFKFYTEVGFNVETLAMQLTSAGNLEVTGDINILGDDINFSTSGFADINNTGTGAIRLRPSGTATALSLNATTSTFATNLEVIDPVSGNFAGEIKVGGNGSSRRLLLKQDTVLEYLIGASGSGSILKFGTGTGAAERMRITDGGNVGIGTDSPNNFGFLEKVLNVSAGSSSSTTLQQSGFILSGSSDANDANDFSYLSFTNYQSTLSNGRVAEIRVSKDGDVDTGSIGFYTSSGSGPAQRMRISGTGVVEITNGIKLGGTAAANLLDDYEEGAWTPVLGGTWTTDPTNITGHYTKIGRQVTVTMQFTGGAKSSSISGYFTGIPFNIIKNGTGSVSDSGVQNLGNCLFANTDRVWFTATNLGSGTVYVSGTYFAA